MYCLVILVLISASEACQPAPCHWSDPTPAINYYSDMVTEQMSVDRKAQQLCYQHGSKSVSTIHYENEYRIVLNAPGFVEADFDVKIKSRVLLVSGISSNNCRSSFYDVRIIPEYLSTSDVVWVYDGNYLIVKFRYEINPILGGDRYCYNRSTTLINVQKDCCSNGYY